MSPPPLFKNLILPKKNPWLNIPTLLWEWLNVSKVTLNYLFKSFNAFNQPMVNKSIKLISFGYYFNIYLGLWVFSSDFSTKSC